MTGRCGRNLEAGGEGAEHQIKLATPIHQEGGGDGRGGSESACALKARAFPRNIEQYSFPYEPQ